MALGLFLSTVQPTDRHVPSTCRTVPWKVRDIDLGWMILAIFSIALQARLPLWVMFLVFFLSRPMSPNSLMIKALVVGWIDISAALFWHFNWIMHRIPLYYVPFLAISSPIFLAFKPRGPSLGARVAAGPCSPPQTLTRTDEDDTVSNFSRVDLGWHFNKLNKSRGRICMDALPLRNMPLVPIMFPTIFRRLQSEFERAFMQYFHGKDGSVQLELKLGGFQCTKTDDEALMKALRRVSKENPMAIPEGMLKYKFNAGIFAKDSEQRFYAIDQFMEQISVRKQKKHQSDFYGELAASSRQLKSICKTADELRLDIRAGSLRFEFDSEGNCNVIQKKRMQGQDNRPLNTDIIYGMVDIRLSINLQQSRDYDQDLLQKTLKGDFTLRLKHRKKFVKYQWVETSLTQVLQIHLPVKGLAPTFQALREEVISAIKQKQLSYYMPSLFSSFYDSSCHLQRRFEVQSELLPKVYQDHKRLKEPIYALAKACYQDIVSLYHAKSFIRGKLSQQMSGSREGPWSVIGDYMHFCMFQ